MLSKGGSSMTVTDKIMQHIQSLPESLQAEVLDFVEYLEAKTGKEIGRAHV